LLKTEAQKQADKRIAEGLYNAMKRAQDQIIANYISQIAFIANIIDGPDDPTNPNDWLDWGEEHDRQVSEDTFCETRTPWQGPDNGWDPDNPPPPDPKDPLL